VAFMLCSTQGPNFYDPTLEMRFCLRLVHAIKANTNRQEKFKMYLDWTKLFKDIQYLILTSQNFSFLIQQHQLACLHFICNSISDSCFETLHFFHSFQIHFLSAFFAR
jgi:hypothetical protein